MKAKTMTEVDEQIVEAIKELGFVHIAETDWELPISNKERVSIGLYGEGLIKAGYVYADGKKIITSVAFAGIFESDANFRTTFISCFPLHDRIAMSKISKLLYTIGLEVMPNEKFRVMKRDEDMTLIDISEMN